MTTRHAAALRARWADPVYRERQTAANRHAARDWSITISDPLRRKQHGLAIRIGMRIGKKGKRR